MGNLKKGDQVKFTCATDNQINWSGTDDPRKHLSLDEIYTIEKVFVYDWHTKIILKEFPEFRFNSVHFSRKR